MSQAEREQGEYEQIVTGPGGLLPPVPENEGLLGVIEKTPPLEPARLLTIAQSYKQFPTSASLGTHLALLALATREGRQAVQEAFTEYATNWLQDLIEDGGEVVRHQRVNDPDEPEGVKTRFTIDLTVCLVKVSGIELLIETITIQSFPDEETEVGHFIIGVNPGPALTADITSGETKEKVGKGMRIRVKKRLAV